MSETHSVDSTPVSERRARKLGITIEAPAGDSTIEITDDGYVLRFVGVVFKGDDGRVVVYPCLNLTRPDLEKLLGDAVVAMNESEIDDVWSRDDDGWSTGVSTFVDVNGAEFDEEAAAFADDVECYLRDLM